MRCLCVVKSIEKNTNASPATTGQISITVEVTSHKPWLARIAGLDGKYGFALDFLAETKRVSKSYRVYTITEAGIYRHVPREIVAESMRRDTGYLRVATDGTIAEIGKEEAIAEIGRFPSDPTGNN